MQSGIFLIEGEPFYKIHQKFGEKFYIWWRESLSFNSNKHPEAKVISKE